MGYRKREQYEDFPNCLPTPTFRNISQIFTDIAEVDKAGVHKIRDATYGFVLLLLVGEMHLYFDC